jgi:hypothetical protein
MFEEEEEMGEGEEEGDGMGQEMMRDEMEDYEE